MNDDRPTDGSWMTYAQAGKILGLTPEGVRALARRKHWSRRSPNAIGGQAWVLVPADRLATATADCMPFTPDGKDDAYQRSESPPETEKIPPTDGDSPAPDGNNQSGQRDPSVSDSPAGRDSDRRESRREDEVLTAVREMAEMLTAPLREQITLAHQQIETLTTQLAAANEQAAAANQRAIHAEDRVSEMQREIDAQAAEHRRVVAMLIERIPGRRSWWPWRRQTVRSSPL